ncbi:unnamed protein product [Rotaria sordida]|uniref:Uncharacterized protein n=1 Tax=Rotaria sordida TaxID=392033 RepID=A0A814SXQ9_9BILA|nr:unnamed protein product [Rotaria sordida]CAF1396024.1 unnamed protein product [Rotaria sordida]
MAYSNRNERKGTRIVLALIKISCYDDIQHPTSSENSLTTQHSTSYVPESKKRKYSKYSDNDNQHRSILVPSIGFDISTYQMRSVLPSISNSINLTNSLFKQEDILPSLNTYRYDNDDLIETNSLPSINSFMNKKYLL